MPTAKPTFAELQASGQALFRQRGITNFSEGSIGGLIVDLFAQYSSQMYDLMTRAEAARDLDLATGQDLDNLARSLGGLVRLAPIRAGSDATSAQLLVTNGSLISLSFPSGTIVWSPNNPSLRFTTSQSLTIPAGQSATTFIEATDTGEGYNVSAGQLTAHNADSHFTITNVSPIVGGSSAETDDEFRFRISQALKAAILGGQSSLIGIRQAMLNLPGVVDVIMKPLSRGNGTLDAVVIPEVGYLPDDDFLTTATEELARVAAAGISVRALAPVTVPVSTTITINASGVNAGLTYTGSLRTLITQVVEAYINTRSVQVNVSTNAPGQTATSTNTSDSMIDYNTLLTQVTNAATSILSNQVQGVTMTFTVGSATDQAAQGDIYARDGEVLRSRAVTVNVNYS